jgi:hypothetical protein
MTTKLQAFDNVPLLRWFNVEDVRRDLKTMSVEEWRVMHSVTAPREIGIRTHPAPPEIDEAPATAGAS